MTIEITLLGTGTPAARPRTGPGRPRSCAPAADRSSSTPGAACCLRLAAAGALPAPADAVLLTHLHSDHITDLNDVITTRWVMSLAPDPAADLRPARHPGGGRRASSPCSAPTSATASPTTTT